MILSKPKIATLSDHDLDVLVLRMAFREPWEGDGSVPKFSTDPEAMVLLKDRCVELGWIVETSQTRVGCSCRLVGNASYGVANRPSEPRAVAEAYLVASGSLV